MKKKILIADDDKDFVDSLEGILIDCGYETMASYEGIRTVEKARKENPDLILLDWKMPAGKGETILEHLKADDSTRQIPVIILTGLHDPEIEKTAHKHGVKAFLHKPYDTNDLIREIAKALAC
jgi:CheY-like chemotaxis protein